MSCLRIGATSASSDVIAAYGINAASGALTPIQGSPFAAGRGPRGVAVDPTGKFLYVPNVVAGTVSVYAINAGSGALTAIPGSPFPAGFGSVAVAGHPHGQFCFLL